MLPGNTPDSFRLGSIGERVVPLIGQDFLEAFKQEGLVGVTKTLPGVVGISTQTYDEKRPARSGGGLGVGMPSMPQMPSMPTMPGLPR